MKKLFDFKMAGSVLLMLAISLVSCKQDLTVQPTPSVEQVAPDKVVDLDIQGVQVKDGVLHFDNGKTLTEARELLNKSNFASIKATFEKMGFKSILMIATEQYDIVDRLRTQEEFETFKRQNEHIFTFDNHEINLKCYSYLMPNLINKEGLVFIGKAVCKYDDKGLIVVEDGNLDKLNRAILSRKSSISDKVTVFDASKLKAETRSTCGIAPNTGWVSGNNWRRGILSCGTETDANPITQTGPSTFSVQMYSYSIGRAQKYLTWFGYWTGVNTNHTLSVNQVSNVWVNNAKTINASQNHLLTFSSTGVSAILYTQTIGACSDFQAFSADDAFSQSSTLYKEFTSIHNNYTNGGGVNANINCQ